MTTAAEQMEEVLSYLETCQHTKGCSKRSYGMLMAGKPCDCGRQSAFTTAQALLTKLRDEESLLNGRDNFIVKQGLWGEFVASLSNPAKPQEKP